MRGHEGTWGDIVVQQCSTMSPEGNIEVFPMTMSIVPCPCTLFHVPHVPIPYVLCPMSMFSSVITDKVFMCHQHAYTPQITHCLTHTVSHHSSRVPLGSSRHLWWRPFRGSKGHYLFLVKHVVVLHACLVFLVPLHHTSCSTACCRGRPPC